MNISRLFKPRTKEEEEEEDEGKKKTLHFRWKERIYIDTARLSTGRKYSRLKSLTLAACLDLNTRFIIEIKSSQNGGAFKIWKALMRTL